MPHLSQYMDATDEIERNFIELGNVTYCILFLACSSVVALTCLSVRIKRTARVRRGREDFERREEAQQMISRLQETFQSPVLVNLTGAQSRQFS